MNHLQVIKPLVFRLAKQSAFYKASQLSKGKTALFKSSSNLIHAYFRTVKCNLALGKLYKQADTERPAIACFKEVLKMCPMSLEAAQNLMELGVKSREVSELMLDVTSQFDWMNQWIQGFSAFASHDYPVCIQTLKQLEDSQPLLRNNLHLLVTLGRALHYSGNFPSASKITYL